VEFDLTIARNFAIALFIGALVGIDREKRKTSAEPVAIGGIRTFILIAEAGALSAWLSLQLSNPWIFVAGVIALAGLVVAGYQATTRVSPESLGLTTEAAALTVFLLGGAAMFGYPEAAVALAIVTSSVLAFKQPIHTLVEKIGTDDLYAGLKLLIATFIALPLLPNQPMDPWGALNPYKLWLLVILISSLSLVGYIAVRWFGQGRGTAITAVAGGLVSSTAVTLSFAKESKETGRTGGGALLVGGILLAWMVMFARVVVEVAVVNRALLPPLLIPILSMGVTAAVGAGWLLRGGASAKRPARSDVPLKNPFSLTAAIRFGLLFAAVLLVVALVQHYLPGRGLYAVAALAGLTDVDAITLSMAGCAGDGSCTQQNAVGSIVIAALTNTLVKAGMVFSLGAASMRAPIAAASAAIVAAGLLALAVA
jgi:uncharacterized membrane protein (DUF4010 family)